MKEVDNSGYTDLDEDLSDMVYVTPRSLILKKNKKKLLKNTSWSHIKFQIT